jgi:hypothetical protein
MGQIKDLSGGYPVAEVYLIMWAFIGTFLVVMGLRTVYEIMWAMTQNTPYIKKVCSPSANGVVMWVPSACRGSWAR